MRFARNLDYLISLLGGSEAVQARLGVGPSALSNYKARASLPAAKFDLLAEAARAAGWQLDPDTLAVAPLTGLRPVVLLIVTGGIAAYKALDLARRLMDQGCLVRAVMTRGAQQFITPLSLSALTAEKVYTDLFDLTDEAEMGHINLARSADLVLVAPASAHFMAKLAHGLADDLASTVCLASEAPLLLAPAMNPVMWANQATADNLDLLMRRGVQLVQPADGDMACGETGTGRLAEVPDIVRAALAVLAGKDALIRPAKPASLAGRHILVTSGPTQEPIDQVRYIANRSSGRQGHAIAAACVARGAQVTLISGPVSLPAPHGVRLVSVETAEEMMAAAEAALPADVAVCAAAVADWRVENAASGKLKKQAGGPPSLQLVENPDILARLSSHSRRPQLVVGFAAESENLINHAQAKLAKKGCDWILANQIAQEQGLVFGAEHNQVVLISHATPEVWPEQDKQAIAEKLADQMADSLARPDAAQ